MKIYQLNECEWWRANSLEEAIATAMNETGNSREDTECVPEVRHSFREQLALDIAAGLGPGVFAGTEF